MKNTENAVKVIAVLSLLLGFSLGQIHRQSLQLKSIKAASFAPAVDLQNFHVRQGCAKSDNLQLRNVQLKMEELRTRLEKKRIRLEEQRILAEDAYVRAMEERERSRLRFELKDPESGNRTIIRIEREE